MTRASSVPMPLARLLAMAYRQLIDQLHVRLKAAGYTDVRPPFGYVLLAVRAQPATAADIALLLGVTKQATSKLIDEMERGGYVKRQAHGDDARAKALVITARGKKFLAARRIDLRRSRGGLGERHEQEARRGDSCRPPYDRRSGARRRAAGDQAHVVSSFRLCEVVAGRSRKKVSARSNGSVLNLRPSAR